MGTFSQSFNALPIEALGGRAAASSIGLRQDLGFRTNVGIVNLDTKSQTFSIELVGERKSSTLALTVEPLSMRQVPIPEGDYAAVMAVFRAGGAGFFWSAYGTSVDNVTGDGWVAQAAALP